MFDKKEAAFVHGLSADFLSSPADDRHGLVRLGEAGVQGAAYWHRVEMADGVTDLAMIAVQPSARGRGLGKALMRHAETRARRASNRLMLVHTSSTEQYVGTRRLYAAFGYSEDATVQDYWLAGDDLVIFRLPL